MTPAEKQEIKEFRDLIDSTRARSDTLDGLTREVLSVPARGDDDTLDGPLDGHGEDDRRPHEEHDP